MQRSMWLLYLPVGVSAFMIKAGPQSLFLNMNKKFRARYDYGENEIPVRKDIRQRFEDVLADLNVSKKDRESIQIFHINHTNIFSAGATYFKRGAIIGIPANFEYEDPQMVTDETISLRNNIQYSLNVEEAFGEFRKSLVLSENAQKFAMAQKILIVTGHDQLIKLCNLITDILISMRIYIALLNTKFAMKYFQLPYKILSAGCIAFNTYLMNTLVENEWDRYQEKENNKKLVKLGSTYIEGGKEYYEKKLIANKALRTAFGAKGPYLFSPTGNEITWFKIPKLEISEQIEFFTLKLKELELA